MIKLMRSAVVVLVATSLAGCGLVIGEGELLRPVIAGSLSRDALAAVAPEFNLARHSITATDGNKLEAVYLTQPGAVATILYFGGNGYTIERFGAITARALSPLNVNLMIVDHRGYGLSQGTPTAANIQTDGISAFDYLSSLPGTGPIIVHGQSLGSFIAGHVAASRETAGVVLESSVTTTEEWAKVRAGNAPVRVTVSDAIKGQGNMRNIPAISEPLLILVGKQDEVTPPRLSEGLYTASHLPPSRKTLAIVDGAGHNDVLLNSAAIEIYGRFLNSLISK
jgi:fermentation-respiration switch protein FrsA (DUF1100 family)